MSTGSLDGRDVVESEIELVEGEVLLRLGRRLARAVLIRVGVVQLDGGEHGVVQAAVERGAREDEDVRLVRLEGRGDGEIRRLCRG